MPPRPPEPGDSLSRRHLATLALVAALVVLDRAVLQAPLDRLTTDAPVLDVTGRQRVLGQRLAWAALEMGRATDPADRRRLAGEMERVLTRWAAAHEGLRFGDPERSLPGRNSRAVRAALEEIDPLFRRIRDAARGLSADGGDPASSLAELLAAEADYLDRMDWIEGLHAAETRARVESLRRTGWAVTGLTLGALIGSGVFILRPAARRIRRQFAEVRDARDALEVLVRERTAELERAEGRHRSLVERFGHVARTTTVGEMAAGLAHELNQPLGAVANYVEGCLVALERPEAPVAPIRSALEKALAATLRAGAIVRRIRRFVTQRPAEPERFAANRVVEEVAALLRDEAAWPGIGLRLDLAPKLPWLSGDPVQVQQVLVNLVRNAMEAVSVAQPPTPLVILETRAADDGLVEFRVTDNGEGIQPERIDRVFDPFFSTRAEGMGMGLAISRTIAEAHGGSLAVESLPGVRTTFRFALPADTGVADATDRLHRR